MCYFPFKRSALAGAEEGVVVRPIQSQKPRQRSLNGEHKDEWKGDQGIERHGQATHPLTTPVLAVGSYEWPSLCGGGFCSAVVVADHTLELVGTGVMRYKPKATWIFTNPLTSHFDHNLAHLGTSWR